MPTVARKICVNCGRPCLESERACWACGSLQFVAPGEEDLIGERTVAVDGAREITESWTVESRDWRPVLYVAGAAAFALLMCIIGFWLGRASQPDASADTETTVAMQTAPVTLPAPPSGLTTAPSLAYDGDVAPPPSHSEPPLVTVRSRAGARPTPSGNPRNPKVNAGTTRAPLPPGISPHPLMQRPAASAPRPPQVTTQRAVVRPSPSVAAPVREGVMPSPVPDSESGVVVFRNNASQTVEISVDDDRWTVIVAPGGSTPLYLPPGTYPVQARADGSTVSRSLLGVGANRSYSLVIEGRQQGGATALVLREPAIDGASGN